MTSEDYNLIKDELHTIERAIASRAFNDPDGCIMNKLQSFCKNNGIPFCRGCRTTLFTTLMAVVRVVKEYEKNNKEVKPQKKNRKKNEGKDL
jgi:hypothetical protein